MNKRLERSLGGASIYLYLNLDGIEIIPEDPIVGEITCLLSEHTDFAPERKHPFVNQKVDYCFFNESTRYTHFFSSDWTVFHVEVFPGNQLVREVVIAWCKKEPGFIEERNKDVSELKECVKDSSIYFYMSPNGINIIPEDPITGGSTCLLNKETDNRPKREYPYEGEKLEYCTITNQLTGAFELKPSDWTVFHVEVFPGSQIVREVVIAWCDKSG